MQRMSGIATLTQVLHFDDRLYTGDIFTKSGIIEFLFGIFVIFYFIVPLKHRSFFMVKI